MQVFKQFLFFCAGLILSTTILADTPAQNPVGYWMTLDHKNNNAPSSIIEITKNSNDEITGDIVHIFEENGHLSTDKCVRCSGPLTNAPIMGLKLVWGFHEDPTTPGKFDNGFVLDPTNGKTYKCHMWLSEDGQQLTVHGYIGISLIGRSDVWLRTTAPAAEKKEVHLK
jgi:uncharacterized protein (DUF2147 family)